MRKIKKIMAVTLVMSMLATMLVACGKDETKVDNPADTTNEVVEETTTTPTEEVGDVETPESEVVEEGTVGDVLDETTEDVEETTEPEIPDTFITSHRFDGGYVDEYQNPDNEEMSDYDVYVNIDGKDIYFTMTAPKGIGETCNVYEGVISLVNQDNTHRLNIWNGSDISSVDSRMVNIAPEELIQYTWGTTPIDTSNYKENENENYYRFTFPVSVEDGTPGYACFMDDYNTNKSYQFEYLERDTLFDETRAQNVVDSIMAGESNFHTP